MKSNAAYKEEDELPKPFKGSLLMYGYDNKTLKQLEAEHASPSPFDTEDDGVHEKSGRNTVNINSGGPLTGGRRRLSAQLQHATNAKKREADAKKKKEASGS